MNRRAKALLKPVVHVQVKDTQSERFTRKTRAACSKSPESSDSSDDLSSYDEENKKSKGKMTPQLAKSIGNAALERRGMTSSTKKATP